MSHILDRPVWSALRTAHAALAEGGEDARRYPPSIVPLPLLPIILPEVSKRLKTCLPRVRSWHLSRPNRLQPCRN